MSKDIWHKLFYFWKKRDYCEKDEIEKENIISSIDKVVVVVLGCVRIGEDKMKIGSVPLNPNRMKWLDAPHRDSNSDHATL